MPGPCLCRFEVSSYLNRKVQINELRVQAMDILTLLNEKVFLGQEFLTWLWYLSEETDTLSLPDGRMIQVQLGELLALGPRQGQEGVRVTVTGKETSLAEARQALKRDKLVDVIRLCFIIDGEEYWLSLRASDLAPRSLRLPASAPLEGAGKESHDGLTLERLALLENLLSALDGLLLMYLTGRLENMQGGSLWQQVQEWAGNSSD